MKRTTKQELLPLKVDFSNDKGYDLYPYHSLARGEIYSGYSALANQLYGSNTIIFEGYVGIDWTEVVSNLKAIFDRQGCSVTFKNTQSFFKDSHFIEEMTAPFLGGDDPIFGHRTSLDLNDYFDDCKTQKIVEQTNTNTEYTIFYGPGSSLLNIKGLLVYFDIPKNELQFRARAGAVTNLGLDYPKSPKEAYKHFYFVDWIVLNKEKKRLLGDIDIFVDQQRPGIPTFSIGDSIRKGLKDMSKSFFRVRPWFEPGVWGGQWIKEKIKDLNQDIPNYAWSFEMIVPENGLLFEADGHLLEVSFDLLMFQEKENVLGKAVDRFQDEFPIRFDFLDTFDGGNLSVQCHPKPEFIKKEFGETFTQDETYYILDAKKGADVYLGFQENINPNEFKTALVNSYETKEVLEVEKYVQKLPAQKHDLFLIPHGTIHCSGIDNMVLEISATPYIFTFKMYDWQRLDLDGSPRPLNIERAFRNLNFDRKGDVVKNTLVSKTTVKSSGTNWQILDLSTHPDHFYKIERYEFEDTIEIMSNDQCHIMMLVEGTSVILEVDETIQGAFNYAETFAVPAAISKYSLKNCGHQTAKVVVSYVKDEAC
ncbi:class I mannose-6-phosphate isomerase [Flagellimonas sp. HMM57]|uniref:class I mannose-6-phosphate isomerase n=1 Tax=unclassified Flagellimonas TaxID=2644544 RepID=UPI0013CFDBE2|nr:MULTISPECIES: class I mannose-6-phosphate isomerase [unclassified Flagellimonas]UII74770.1 class I mannose-6-phosphate isomerase [Flagellimonas sp. HMM57]